MRLGASRNWQRMAEERDLFWDYSCFFFLSRLFDFQ
jgi:hypothetical protein